MARAGLLTVKANWFIGKTKTAFEKNLMKDLTRPTFAETCCNYERGGCTSIDLILKLIEMIIK